MNAVFADTHFWIALTFPHDAWGEAARAAKARLAGTLLVTTDEVLSEFATSLSGYGPRMRQQVAVMVRAILAHPSIKVMPQTRESFLRGLARYE